LEAEPPGMCSQALPGNKINKQQITNNKQQITNNK
jgi:hypothetical protein